ncbi:MAG: hypothetical protein NC131_20520 [Roseburia sp.]|nr:hypothetical protein [Roseburia sp.]
MNKEKAMRRVISALLAVLLCFSCIGSPAVFAAESGMPTPSPAGYDEDGTTVPDSESVPEDAAADTIGGILPEESVREQPEKAAESEPELTFSNEVQAFIDAVDALDREQILSTANSWGLAHKAWLQDQENADLKAALDAAVAESDEAAASLYAAEDLYYEVPEDERESEAVQAAYLSLMSLIVAMQLTMENPTESTDPGTGGGNEPPSGDEIATILYGDLPDAPADYYMGSYGLPVAVGETKISIGEWADELMSGNAGRLDADALNTDGLDITVSLQAGADYAIVPIMVQVEYPANGSSSTIILPDGTVLLSQDGSGKPASADEAANILNSTYTESSAAASGILVRASEDFTARFVYEAPDGTKLEKSLTVHVDKGNTQDFVLYGLRAKGSSVFAERPTPSVTSGRITQIQQTNGTWLIWFNGQEAYCCDHGLTGKADGCPTYSYSHTSIVEGSQYTPGDHYRNQVEIWGGLNQLSLGLLSADAATFAARSEDENAADCYDNAQRWVMQHYPDSLAAQVYKTAIDQLMSGSSTYATDTDYYCYIYQPPIGGWQQVAVIGPPTDGSETPDEQPKYYSS